MVCNVVIVHKYRNKKVPVIVEFEKISGNAYLPYSIFENPKKYRVYKLIVEPADNIQNPEGSYGTIEGIRNKKWVDVRFDNQDYWLPIPYEIFENPKIGSVFKFEAKRMKDKKIEHIIRLIADKKILNQWHEMIKTIEWEEFKRYNGNE